MAKAYPCGGGKMLKGSELVWFLLHFGTLNIWLYRYVRLLQNILEVKKQSEAKHFYKKHLLSEDLMQLDYAFWQCS